MLLWGQINLELFPWLHSFLKLGLAICVKLHRVSWHMRSNVALEHACTGIAAYWFMCCVVAEFNLWLSDRRISATFSGWVATEFLGQLVTEGSQNFCNNLWLSDRRIFSTSSGWVVAEFVRQLVTEWSQNFCDIQCLSGCRISATTCNWVIAELLWQHGTEWLQNFCDILWLSGHSISVTSSDWVVT